MITGARRPAPTGASLTTVVLGVVLVLSSSITVQLVAAWQLQVAVGVLITVALFAMAAGARSRAVGDLLAALAALSVFGWFSAGITAVPAIETWLQAAPIPLAFLVVNATKLSSVAVLVVVAHHRGWTTRDLMLRRGGWNAPTAIPGIRWGVAGPVVIIVVSALFLTSPEVLHNPSAPADPVSLLLAAAPLALAGAVVNAGCEELLYRHGLVSTAIPVMGTVAAVLVSSAVFGLGHLTGSPGGWIGVGATFVHGLVCVLAMLQNRGPSWNLTIHVCGDLGAVTALLLAAA